MALPKRLERVMDFSHMGEDTSEFGRNSDVFSRFRGVTDFANSHGVSSKKVDKSPYPRDLYGDRFRYNENISLTMIRTWEFS